MSFDTSISIIFNDRPLASRVALRASDFAFSYDGKRRPDKPLVRLTQTLSGRPVFAQGFTPAGQASRKAATRQA